MGVLSAIGCTLARPTAPATYSSNIVRLFGVGPYVRRNRTHALEGGALGSFAIAFCSVNCLLPWAWCPSYCRLTLGVAALGKAAVLSITRRQCCVLDSTNRWRVWTAQTETWNGAAAFAKRRPPKGGPGRGGLLVAVIQIRLSRAHTALAAGHLHAARAPLSGGCANRRVTGLNSGSTKCVTLLRPSRKSSR